MTEMRRERKVKPAGKSFEESWAEPRSGEVAGTGLRGWGHTWPVLKGIAGDSRTAQKLEMKGVHVLLMCFYCRMRGRRGGGAWAGCDTA